MVTGLNGVETVVLLHDGQVLVTIDRWVELARRHSNERDGFNGRRNARRYVWREPMELLVDDEIIQVSSRDISEHGIGLTCRERIWRRTTYVHVRRNDSEPWIKARVSHVTRGLAGYLIGLDFVTDV